jgi:glycerate-2-kinase
VFNHVIGSNRVALEAAARAAKDLGYAVRSLGSENQGEARDVGVKFAEHCRSIRDRGESAGSPICVLSGGEPVVKLVPCDRPRKGGRNQELVLAAVERMWDDGLRQIAILSGGTDGEDGPTDAAGAVADAALIERARSLGLRTQDFLAINNSYPFFEATGGLLKTGPTHTNVMDLRVGVIGR